jgi:tetratricopeptide (TPR) repeat protein
MEGGDSNLMSQPAEAVELDSIRTDSGLWSVWAWAPGEQSNTLPQARIYQRDADSMGLWYRFEAVASPGTAPDSSHWALVESAVRNFHPPDPPARWIGPADMRLLLAEPWEYVPADNASVEAFVNGQDRVQLTIVMTPLVVHPFDEYAQERQRQSGKSYVQALESITTDEGRWRLAALTLDGENGLTSIATSACIELKNCYLLVMVFDLDDPLRTRSEMLREFIEEAPRATSNVRIRADSPQDWAATQYNLGNVLSKQASESPGPERVRLLGEAVAAYRAALEVRTRADLPQDWATTQKNLGNALSDQASESTGPERVRLLGEAVAAYHAALEVYTRADLPQDWASTQNLLGLVLRDQASATVGPERARLLEQAVTAYRAALEVRTRADLPQDWATTQNNLGNALRDQAGTEEGPERVTLLQSAAAAMRAALGVFTREVDPDGFAAREAFIAAVEAEIASLQASPD